MIRFLQYTFILSSLLLICSSSLIAQNEVDFSENITAQKIFDSYGGFDHAVLKMNREEWKIVRAWEGFDENAYLETLFNFKASFSRRDNNIIQVE